jgi:hypothetical protein
LLLESCHDLLVDHRLGPVQLGLLLVLFVKQTVSFEHELHLLLWLLKNLGQLRTHDIWQPLHLRVFLLDQLYELVNLSFEVVQRLSVQHTALDAVEHAFDRGVFHFVSKSLFSISLAVGFVQGSFIRLGLLLGSARIRCSLQSCLIFLSPRVHFAVHFFTTKQACDLDIVNGQNFKSLLDSFLLLLLSLEEKFLLGFFTSFLAAN